MDFEGYKVDENTKPEAGKILTQIVDITGHTTMMIPHTQTDVAKELIKDQLKQGRWAYLRDEGGRETTVMDFDTFTEDIEEMNGVLRNTQEMIFGLAVVGG
jgi:hypothetical protein